ncbi:MAG TPA: tripartite tricarboxylate transporter substrate binding protein [Gemmatimonadales bacterium]|nr:tripartite tricarboxylate transporter substrate binding protein [Gemmatimonadales bacterium]
MSRIALLALLALTTLPCAAEYPDRSVTILAGFPPGGLVDIVTRVVADGMKAKFPKGLTVVNKAGAGGAVAVEELVRSKPDGYTILLTPQSSLVIAPQMNTKLSYKTPDEYDPVINTVAYYPLLVVNADAPWKTIQDFVADAKANPGKMRVGTPGEGTASHLNLEEFIFRTGTKMTPVPFAGWGQSSPALLGGHIEGVIAQPGEAKPQVEGKRMRALVVFQEKRHPAFPDAPTAKEAGWDVANGVWYLIVMPKGTPAPIVKVVHDAAKAVVDSPEFRKTMDARGVDVDDREGEALRADLWREYKLDTEILRRIGLVKP